MSFTFWTPQKKRFWEVYLNTWSWPCCEQTLVISVCVCAFVCCAGVQFSETHISFSSPPWSEVLGSICTEKPPLPFLYVLNNISNNISLYLKMYVLLSYLHQQQVHKNVTFCCAAQVSKLYLFYIFHPYNNHINHAHFFPEVWIMQNPVKVINGHSLCLCLILRTYS